MASLDDAERNREFAESLGVDFPILSDPEGEAARAYGVLAPGGDYAQRSTFFIDAAGVIRYIDREVSPDSHGADIATRLAELGFPPRDPADPTEPPPSDPPTLP